jgi:beta-phosphoglucomutase-like phosphatase (HAD superfamily)
MVGGRAERTADMSLPRMPAAVVFDMDGLLFDTEALWPKALLSAAAEGGREVADELFSKSIGVPRSQCKLFLSHFGEDFLFDDFHAKSSRTTVERHLTAYDLAGRFDVIVARGDYAAGKPAPDPFLVAAERMHVEPHSCLALEDSYSGIRSASAAGMTTIMVPDLLEPTEEISALCHIVAGDPHEVRRLIVATAHREKDH